MSIANFPASMNLGAVKESCLKEAKPNLTRIKSDSTSYTALDTIRMEIPCGRRGDYLHPQDSFIEFKMKVDFAVTAGGLSLDANAYSIFRNLRIYHGSNLLVNQTNCNRLWSALYDYQYSNGERNADTISLGIATDTVNSRHNGMYGITLTDDAWYQFSFVLPCSILGSLSDKAIPLGWAGASNIFLELDIDGATRILTTREHNSLILGRVGQNTTAPPTINSLVIADVFYNAKITNIDSAYDDLLRQTFGNGEVLLPAVEFRGEQKTVSASTSFSDKFSFQFSSAKFILWWLTTQSTANGSAYGTHNLNSAISQRMMGTLRDYMISLNGENYPSSGISCALNGLTTVGSRQFGANAYQQLLRCFNENSAVNRGGILDYNLYCNNVSTVAGDETAKRFIGALSLDRVDGNNDRYMSGMNTMNSNFVLNVNWETALSIDCFLYCYCQYDCAYMLKDGLLSVRY